MEEELKYAPTVETLKRRDENHQAAHGASNALQALINRLHALSLQTEVQEHAIKELATQVRERDDLIANLRAKCEELARGKEEAEIKLIDFQRHMDIQFAEAGVTPFARQADVIEHEALVSEPSDYENEFQEIVEPGSVTEVVSE